MAAIVAAHYGETVAKLKAHPVVRGMALDLIADGMPKAEMVHPGEDAVVRHEFMGIVNAGFRKLGGHQDGPMHLGAVGKAIVELIEDEDEAWKAETFRYWFVDADGEYVATLVGKPGEVTKGKALQIATGARAGEWNVEKVEIDKLPEELLALMPADAKPMWRVTVAKQG